MPTHRNMKERNGKSGMETDPEGEKERGKGLAPPAGYYRRDRRTAAREECRHRSCPVHPCPVAVLPPITPFFAAGEEALQQLNPERDTFTRRERELRGEGSRASRRTCHCPRTAADPCCAKPAALFLPPLAPPGFRPSPSLRELTEVVGGCHRSLWFCVELRRYHDRNSSPLLLEVAAGLPPNRFGDRRCFGSAVPFIVSWLGAEVLVAGISIADFGLRRKGLCDAFGLWFCVEDCGMVLLGPEPGGKVQVLGEMLPEFI
ncbi:uncharacterized protein DS421_13g418750 [Arachis hypogaea]|nr:uncharacterized protein DS421_13g418750 [Arachis hypogaea]